MRQRHGLWQAVYAVLGRDVGRPERRSDQRVRGRRVDDAAPATFLHAGHGGADAVERRRQVDRDDGFPFFGREFLDRRYELYTGIVDETIDRDTRIFAERSHFVTLGEPRPRATR